MRKPNKQSQALRKRDLRIQILQLLKTFPFRLQLLVRMTHGTETDRTQQAPPSYAGPPREFRDPGVKEGPP